MAVSNNSNAQDDEVSSFIDQLYSDLMMLRFEYMALRKKGRKDTDDMLTKIVDMNDDFESLIKAHTLYLRFKKATGQTLANHSAEMIKKINEIKSNMGKIVSEVPRQ
jgi:ribosomal protein L29